jgi:tRNA (cmo5U34)-methyltransferase
MAESEMKWWSEKDYAFRYLEEADLRIMDRRRQLEILKSFYRLFLGDKKGNNVLDLGCGDGILTRELLQIDNSISATLIDGSEDMLNMVRERLADYENMRFIGATFQELLTGNIRLREFDFVVSSLAIHHLTSSEKQALFAYVYSIMVEGGCFVNIDLALAPTKALEKWNLELWKEWMVEKEAELGIESNHEWVLNHCQEEDHYSRIDTLASQLRALEEAGFTDVDCFYKHGIFVMYGGRKKSFKCFV